MLLAILTAEQGEAQWVSFWYEGPDYLEIIPSLRAKCTESGLTFSRCYPIAPPAPWNALLETLHARHGETFRKLCLHAFALGYAMSRNGEFRLEYGKALPPAGDNEVAQLQALLSKDTKNFHLLVLIMSYGLANEAFDRNA